MSRENWEKIVEILPEEVTLVAVSKTKPVAAIQDLYDAGQRVFGENKVQELCEKEEVLPKDIQWHMIGHLQRNKVKYMASFVTLIHGVDSLRLLEQINKEAARNNRVIDCLLQFHIAEEESKFGLNFEEASDLLESDEFIQMENVRIVGIMGMASNTSDEEQVRDEFRTLRNYFEILKSHYFRFNEDFKEVSMGMSGDYLLAVEEGSTMVRIGSALFGQRN
ncbi:MAG: YggS family pyridoxal phosphate-dependent enzyme [Bacteroidetes bacterium]|nr:MAG: YggS family pyridoxal phosphate-dependent enzyme [Bacteroidota bacterium]